MIENSLPGQPDEDRNDKQMIALGKWLLDEKTRNSKFMNASTQKVIEAVLIADGSVTPEQRVEILRVCSHKPLAKPNLVGVKQAAQVLSCHPKTIYRYVRKGLLHSVHYSRRKVRFDLNEVEAFAASGLPDANSTAS